jgi:hypothetical protein
LFDDQTAEGARVPGYAREADIDVFAQARVYYQETEQWLAGAEAAELAHAECEERLAGRGRELLRLLHQAQLDLRAAREPRRELVTGPDGVARRRAEQGHRRQLATIFGRVTVTRIAYRAPGAPNVHPADEQLSLPPGRHSHGLCRRVVIEDARGSFGQACAAITRATGVRIGKRQAEEIIRAAAADFGDFYRGRERRRPPGAAPGDVLCLSCDAKGIVMRPGQLRAEAARNARKAVPRQEGRLSRGEVKNRKRMAEVGAVFDIIPAARTADDILPPPGRHAGPPPPAPRATGKWLTASVADDAAAVVAAVFAEADRRDPAHQRTWVALADGNVHQIRRIRAEAAARKITITIVCDFIHVIEYLQTAAWCFFPEASPDAGPWVRARARAVLHGQATQVAAAIRDAITAAGTTISAAKRKAATRTASYLDAKAPWLDYPAALASGWPISSGVIEGACRYLVKDRMDITGARWGTTTAEAVLKIRALLANDDFDAYWAYHLAREHQRNHPQPRTSHELAA